MLSDIYYRKKLGTPYLSTIFIASCLLVTIPTYFASNLYMVFGGTKEKYYIWQYLTLIFEHGSYNVPIFAHLAVNVLGITFFGVISERVLGTRRFAILNISAAVVYYLSVYMMNGLYGNGGSGIIWSYTSLSLYIFYYLYKDRKNRTKKDLLFYIYIAMIFIYWIVITILDYTVYGQISLGIKSHFLGIVVGFVIGYLYRGCIKRRVDSIISGKYKESVRPNIYAKLAFLIPIFIFVVLCLNFLGVLDNHISTAKITDIVPDGSLQELNEVGHSVRVEFSQPMLQECEKTSLYHSSENEHEKLSMDIQWLDTKTLEIELSREIFDDEKIKIALGGLLDSHGRIVKEDVVIEYGSY